MHSPRILRSIEAVLDQAEAAVARADWDAVVAATRRVLAIDPTNQDAASFLRMAQASLEVPAASSLLIAIDDQLRAHESATEAMSDVSRIAASTASGAAAERVYAAPARFIESDIVPTPIRGIASPAHAAPDIAVATDEDDDDESAATAIMTHASSRRRHYVIVGAYETPRRFVPLSARGPLMLIAGIVAATFALTTLSPAGPEPTSIAARVAEPAPAAETPATPAPALVVPPPLATPEAAPVAPIVPITIEASAPIPAVAPAVTPAIVVPVAPKPRQYQGVFTGTLGRIVAVNGCAWDTPFEASVDASVLREHDGTMSGSATSLVRIAYVVMHTPEGATCNASVVTNEATGPITGDDQELSGTLTGPKELAISFRGTRTDTALVGDATIQRNLGTMSTFGQTSAMGMASGTNLVLAGI